jgi:hypothetical protein
MAFNQTDVYTSSGSVMLFNSWTPYVSKFDTSTFYNWEQDNLPLYDLEERTYALWEQQGFATSAGVPGLALTVSADAPAATLAANTTIFTDLSSCIAAIPKVVRFPVFVEVNNFGDLGTLELHNFRFEERGSIEIVNRGFARTYAASSQAQTVVSQPTDNKSHTLISIVSSLDLSNTLSDTSSVHISSLVLSAGAADTRLAGAVTNSFMYPRHTLVKAPVSVSIGFDSLIGGNTNQFTVNPYEQATFASDDTMATLDISATNQSTALRNQRAAISTGESVAGNIYLNNVKKISVKNCGGPVYIRNFFADALTTEENAIEVTNSDVVLENCAGVRAKRAGWKFHNSRVVLSRSALAYRNYPIRTTTSRIAGEGAGFHAVNSQVTVSSVPQTVTQRGLGDTGAVGSDCNIIASRNYAGFVLENSKLTGGVAREFATNASGGSVIASELNTGYGLLLRNSFVDTTGLLDIYANNVGIEANNSNITYEYLCAHANQEEGILSKNSTILFDSSASPQVVGQADRSQLEFSGNGQHLSLDSNSHFGFVRKNNTPYLYGNSKFFDNHGVSIWDGANKAAYPAISVEGGSTLELLKANLQVTGTAENIANTPSYGRAIKVENNSTASLYGTSGGCTFIMGPAGYTYQRNMAGVYAGNGSVVNVHGPTAMAQFGVNILAEDNSTINIEPARSKDKFGIDVNSFDLSSGLNHTSVELHSTRACLVANKNSTLNMTDLGSYPVNWERTTEGLAFLNSGSDYDVDAYGTSAYTSSGCLQFYPNPQDSTTIAAQYLDDLTNGAGLNFAPGNFPSFTAVAGLNRLFITQEVLDTTYGYSFEPNLSYGGVCVRATEDSVVNATNVHFPIGSNGSFMDGLYYTSNKDECSRFGIWNIADTSRLNAAYLSTSGMHPASNLTHGPSSLWMSAVVDGGADYVPASGAPAGTPDTGSLSILDAFGAGSSVWFPTSGVAINSPVASFYPVDPNTMTQVEAQALDGVGVAASGFGFAQVWGCTPHTSNNRGPFRIYWTPKSTAKLLMTDLSGYNKGAFLTYAGDFSGVVGPAYQIFAQGYNCSADLSAVPVTGELNASSVAPDLLKLSYDGDGDGVKDSLWTSGFYYCSEMLEEDPTQCMLDESAADSFANAKNASIGMAGRPKKVTLFRARQDLATNRGAEAYPGDTSGTQGFKSAGVFDLKGDN